VADDQEFESRRRGAILGRVDLFVRPVDTDPQNLDEDAATPGISSTKGFGRSARWTLLGLPGTTATAFMASSSIGVGFMFGRQACSAEEVAETLPDLRCISTRLTVAASSADRLYVAR